MASFHATQKGGVIVEAAITLPLLFTVLAAVVQFGYAYSVLLVMQNASLIAARSAVLSEGRTSSQVCDLARASVSTMVDPALLECVTQPATLPAAQDTLITIALSYPIPVFFVGNLPAMSDILTLRVQSTMQ